MTSNVTMRKLKKNSRTIIGKLHSTIFSLLNNEKFITVLFRTCLKFPNLAFIDQLKHIAEGRTFLSIFCSWLKTAQLIQVQNY